MNWNGPGPDLLLLPLQLGAILLATWLCGLGAQRLKQPRVVGEIAGGLLLGPVALGRLFPAGYGHLFPANHLAALELVSSVGLVLFLFLTGAELDIAAVRKNRGATLAITLGNIGLPFFLGALFASTLRERFGMKHVSPTGFLLFTGIAMSITALPVLARILQERGRGTYPVNAKVAATALVCSAANDLIAWSLLAIALALIHSHNLGLNLAMTCGRLAILLVYVAVMLQVIRPVVKRILIFSKRQPRTWLWMPCALIFAFVSAHITDMLGVHAFFGAFLAGVCVPMNHRRGAKLDAIMQKTMQPVIRFALPVFFAMTGLRMKAGTLPHENLRWLWIVLTIAIFGKIVGGMLPARATGMGWKHAVQTGVLMNTRGLVELIVLNVGLKEGVLSPQLFSIFVLMAILTTAMTVPLLDISEWISHRRRATAVSYGTARSAP